MKFSLPAALLALIAAVTDMGSADEPKPAFPWPDRYMLRGADGVVCATVSCSFSFVVHYNTTNGTTSSSIVKPPCPGEANITVNGMCGEKEESLVINFPDMQSSIRFDLHRDDGSFALVSIGLVYVLNGTLFPDASDPGSRVTYNSSRLTLFNTSVGMFYSCRAGASYDLGYNYTIQTHDFYILAFSNVTDLTNMSKNVCTADIPMVADSTVPIAVGIALAALTVIIVAAYLISSRTTGMYQRVGLQSMSTTSSRVS